MGWNSSRCRTHQAVAGSILSECAMRALSLRVCALQVALGAGCDSSRHMTSRRLMTLQVVVPPAQKLGAVPHGTRDIVPIASGTIEGPRLRGKVLPGGGDWPLLRAEALVELEWGTTLETEH